MFVDTIDEEKFFRGVKKLPPQYLHQYLTFNILPEEMKQRLHKNLQEVCLFDILLFPVTRRL